MGEAEFSNNTIGEQLRSHLLPLLEARHEDVVEVRVWRDGGKVAQAQTNCAAEPRTTPTQKPSMA